MAADNDTTPPSGDGLSPAKRKRLEKMFEHATKQMSQESYDYANELFTECVVTDPTNLLYVQNFIANLQKKYNNNKKGSNLAFIQGAGARRAVKKAGAQDDWLGVIKTGCDVLKLNPWDIPTLLAMAKATEKIGAGDSPLDAPLCYLKCALDANPKDAEVNRECALAMEERGQLDQAIACWHRVEQALPDSEEAQRQIAALAVKKTVNKLEGEAPQKKRAAGQAGQTAAAQQELTPEQRLERKIAQDPEDASAYLELAQLHTNHERFKEAEQVFAKAYEVSGGALEVLERWEDAQVRYLRYQLLVLQKKRESGDAQAKQEYKRIRKVLNDKETEIFKNRVERYPNNLKFKYDLGVRYQIAGEYQEAIKQFQLARNDPRYKGVCLLALGQCFQQIGQLRLALGQYESAIQEIPDRDTDNKKLALYLTAKVCAHQRNLETAEKYLTVLLAMDFSYKDAAALLDKVNRMRDNTGESEKPEGEGE